MNPSEISNLLKRKKGTIFSIFFVFLLGITLFTFSQPLKHGATSSLLVVQNFSYSDPYSASRSNQYLGGLLASVVSSDAFYNDVMNSSYNIDRSYFYANGNPSKELEKWEETVSAKAPNDLGIIEIQVYHQDKNQLTQIAQAVNYVLQTKHSEYHGAGNDVQIKIINRPIVSDFPVKPNVFLNYFLALVVALLFSSVYIYLFPEDKYNLRLWPKRKRKSGEEAAGESVWGEPTAGQMWNAEPVAVSAEEEYQPTETMENYSEDADEIKDDYSDNESTNETYEAEPEENDNYSDTALEDTAEVEMPKNYQPEVYAENQPLITEDNTPIISQEDNSSPIIPEEQENQVIAPDDEFFSEEKSENSPNYEGNMDNLFGRSN